MQEHLVVGEGQGACCRPVAVAVAVNVNVNVNVNDYEM
jgi:hypothetical protein